MYKKCEHIHFIGVGGIGMSGIAEILRLQGYKVSGCDEAKTSKTLEHLRSLGCTIMHKHDKDHVKDAEVVVYSSAVSQDNPEVVAARSQDLAGKLPFGTVIELDGSNVSPDGNCGYSIVAPKIGYRVIADTMSARYANRVDVLLDTKNAAQTLGVCKGITIRVVGRVGINHIPNTQIELARLVRGDKSLALK